jgi:hypothetical protein
MPVCKQELPATVDVGSTTPHYVTCHLYTDRSSRTGTA